MICEKLEEVEAGRIKRLMILMPPQHGKSELSTRRFPAWMLGRHPHLPIISASYNADFAADFGRDVRDIISDESYRELWDLRLRGDSRAVNRWHTDRGGSYIGAGIGTGITGRGAGLGLIDDPFKDRQEAESPRIRETVWQWYTSTFYTRLAPEAPIVMTLTRWHEDDLAGRALAAMAAGGERWEVLSLPALAGPADELGRREGEALWPERYSLEVLERIRGVLRSRSGSGVQDWESLYQQSPVVVGGNLVKRAWWRRYRELPGTPSLKVQSWDTAFKKGQENDFSVCLTLGIFEPNIYGLDRYKERVEYPELRRAVVEEAERHNPHGVLIEDRASGQSLIQDLRANTRVPVVAVRIGDQDKIARLNQATPLIEGGRVWLPEGAEWAEDLINVLAAFPNGAFDDDADALSQGLNYLRERLGARYRELDLR